MIKIKISEKLIRWILGILLLVVAINAFAGGYYGLSGAKNIPTEWLKGSPFRDYFIPGFFLFVIVGGTSVFAAITVFRSSRIARKAGFICGSILLLWLTVQVAIIGYVSWMQPATTLAALIILFLTSQLPRYEY
ncbi:MAG: hypothetical protein JST10_11635 [Bacteroidetes bacterium]|nr:hypothetical protein [Bacteroidota bacterium]MBS1633210.1 hypothetical protein [Bacteroidota bacterium]